MIEWTIWYSFGRIDGLGASEWRAAPTEDVQVVVEWRAPCHPCSDGRSERRFVGVTDRVLHTGIDEYNPFGYGIKYGAWMTDDDYQDVWEVAAYGDR